MNQLSNLGFSGVLFALKVLVNTYFPHENERILGWMPIPARYACWAELIIIQMLTPNVSFVGHLAGILVGLLYTMGPLKAVTDIICSVVEEPTYNYREGVRPTPSAPLFEDEDTPQTWGNVFSGRGATTGTQNNSTNSRFNTYTGGLSEEEQIRRAMEESVRSENTRRRYGWNLD